MSINKTQCASKLTSSDSETFLRNYYNKVTNTLKYHNNKTHLLKFCVLF